MLAIALGLWSCSGSDTPGSSWENPGGDGLASDGGATSENLAVRAGLIPGACTGYTVIQLGMDGAKPRPRVLLLDMLSRVVHSWSIIGEPFLLLEGGSVQGAFAMRGEGYETEGMALVQIDWQGKTEWSFSDWDAHTTDRMMSRHHHDMAQEGNPSGYYAPGQHHRVPGKTLVLAHRNIKAPSLSKRELIDEVIYELDREQRLTGFTWYATDHIHEMGFDAKAMQAIYDSPGIYPHANTGDWLHINSIALLGPNRHYDKNGDIRFHPDNILISAREASFLAIISRESGQIVWRFGPDIKAGTPEAAVGQVVGQHHATMIPRGLPGEGNILVFDNGGVAGYGGDGGGARYKRTYSRVVEFDPVTFERVWEFGSPSGENSFLTLALGSAQRLPNGNTLIGKGVIGTAVEVTPAGKIVWEFSVMDVAQGLNMPYRVLRVPPDWLPSGFNPAGYPFWKDAYAR